MTTPRCQSKLRFLCSSTHLQTRAPIPARSRHNPQDQSSEVNTTHQFRRRKLTSLIQSQRWQTSPTRPTQAEAEEEEEVSVEEEVAAPLTRLALMVSSASPRPLVAELALACQTRRRTQSCLQLLVPDSSVHFHRCPASRPLVPDPSDKFHRCPECRPLVPDPSEQFHPVPECRPLALRPVNSSPLLNARFVVTNLHHPTIY